MTVFVRECLREKMSVPVRVRLWLNNKSLDFSFWMRKIDQQTLFIPQLVTF